MDKIILVEDDMLLRDLFSTFLQKGGYELLTAADGEQAIELAKSNPDAKLMLLDIMLPKVHGLEVLKQVKADSSTQKLTIYLLTNLTEENIVQEALHMGAAGYLVKVHFTPKELLDKVNEIIQSHQQPQG